MSVYIKQISIKNFKCFKEVSIDFNKDFNLIIGGNNSGKSTVFDALRLWQLAFVKFLKDRTNNQQSSFRVHQYYSFTLEDISFLRVTEFEKLTLNKNLKKFEISITLCGNNNLVKLPIFFTRTSEGQNLRFELCKQKNRSKASDELSNVLNVSKGSDFKNTLLFTYINPIFTVPLNEPLYSKGFIINSLHLARVNKVIRNLLHPHAPLKKQKANNPNKKRKSKKLIEIEKDLDSIISGTNTGKVLLEFSTQLEDEDIYINIFGKNNCDGIEVELSQLGSGTLNMLNILSVLAFGDFERFKLNVLLLDEPDSHLHANHQKKLFEYLNKKSKEDNKQIFIITHNHQLIECFQEVIFLERKHDDISHSINSISKESYYSIYSDIATDYHRKMIEIDDKKKIQKQLDKITKPTIYCEGTTDVAILKCAFTNLYNKEEFFDGKIDISGLSGEGDVGNKLKHSKPDITIIGILDNDSAGQNQLLNLQKNNKFKNTTSTNFHYVMYYKESNNSAEVSTNTHLLMLPIPNFRLEMADFFNNNLFIEYMFTNESLGKLGVELIEEKGTTFKKIKTVKNGGKISICPSEKAKVTKNINRLVKNDFTHFIPLFEKIAEVIEFNLPND